MDLAEEGANKGGLAKWSDFPLQPVSMSHLWDIFVHILTQETSFSSDETLA